MPYHLISFDDIALPAFNPREQHDPPPSSSGLMRSIGGTFDYYGTSVAAAMGQALTHTAVYVGEITYLVDENSDFLVDESGDYIIGGTAIDSLAEQVAALRAKVRTSGTLIRQRLADGYREWKTARLVSIRHPVNFSDPIQIAEMTSAFELVDEGWHAEIPSVYSRAIPDDETTSVFVQNGSSITVYDAVITITWQSGTITAVVIASTDAGISINWTGSLTTGSVVIDAGLSTVRKNGVNSYPASFLGVGHTARGWLPLEPGQTELEVTVTGGTATARVEFYEQTA